MQLFIEIAMSLAIFCIIGLLFAVFAATISVRFFPPQPPYDEMDRMFSGFLLMLIFSLALRGLMYALTEVIPEVGMNKLRVSIFSITFIVLPYLIFGECEEVKRWSVTMLMLLFVPVLSFAVANLMIKKGWAKGLWGGI